MGLFAIIIRWIVSFVVNLFFRQIESHNTHKIPQTGPVIFVCAPHANQFLDPLVVMEKCPREIGFMTAAKSMRRKFIGAMARAFHSIPVERPQDIAKKGTGLVTNQEATIIGHGTKFTEDIKAGMNFILNGESYIIAKVESDTKLTLNITPTKPATTPSPFKVAPKLDQSTVFEGVFEHLHSGKCMGIFPEGGSHDRADLLPLKAGVTIMALGAVAKYPDLPVKIICVGLNYFNGHKFRSRAFLDFGDPIDITPDMVEKYKAGGETKRKVCGDLLSTIYQSLNSLVVTAPNHDSLQLMWTVRRLYSPDNMTLTTEAKCELARKFGEVEAKFFDHPKIAELRSSVKEYTQHLEDMGLRDHQVRRASLSHIHVLWLLFSRSLFLFILVICGLPGFILNFPILVAARVISAKKAEQALRESDVKVLGRDVLATWKVLVALTVTPICFIIYSGLSAIVGWQTGLGALYTWIVFTCALPFLCYSSVRVTEVGLHLVRSLKPLLIALFKRDAGLAIRQERETLQYNIRQTVNELGPVFFGPEFNANRLIRPESFQSS